MLANIFYENQFGLCSVLKLCAKQKQSWLKKTLMQLIVNINAAFLDRGQSLAGKSVGENSLSDENILKLSVTPGVGRIVDTYRSGISPHVNMQFSIQ